MKKPTIFDEESDMEIELPYLREVCWRCDGEGTHTNPAIDGNGICADDEIMDDPDFLGDYMSGMYDIVCQTCDGENVIAVVDRDKCDPVLLAQHDQEQQEISEMRAADAQERAMGA